MNEALGPTVLDARSPTYLETARCIAAEVQRLMREAEARVKATLTEHRKELELLAQMLLKTDTVDRDAFLCIFDQRDRSPDAGAPVKGGVESAELAA